MLLDGRFTKVDHSGRRRWTAAALPSLFAPTGRVYRREETEARLAASRKTREAKGAREKWQRTLKAEQRAAERVSKALKERRDVERRRRAR